VVSGDAVHQVDQSREQTTESSSGGGCGEEERDPEVDLVSSVPLQEREKKVRTASTDLWHASYLSQVETIREGRRLSVRRRNCRMARDLPDTGEQSRFSDSQEDSGHEQTFEVFDEAHADHDNAPSQHDDGQPHGGSRGENRVTQSEMHFFGFCKRLTSMPSCTCC
jgi:hypothetical protein